MSPLPAVSATLAAWHEMVRSGDMSRLADLIHPAATFHSPVAFTPYRSSAALVLALSTVSQVFEDFKYHRQFVSEDAVNVVLEFSAPANGKQLKGVDLIRFDADGKTWSSKLWCGR